MGSCDVQGAKINMPHAYLGNLKLLLGTEVPVTTPSGAGFSFLAYLGFWHQALVSAASSQGNNPTSFQGVDTVTRPGH